MTAYTSNQDPVLDNDPQTPHPLKFLKKIIVDKKKIRKNFLTFFFFNIFFRLKKIRPL